MAVVVQVTAPMLPPPAKWKQFLASWWLLIVLIILAAAGSAAGALWLSPQIRFLSGKDLDLARALTPLAMAAIFIERAVEVLVSPWREADAATLENAVKAAAAASASPATDSDVQDLKDDLNQYRGTTKQVAFLLAFVLSLIAALVGVRAIGPFLADNGLNALTPVQRELFSGYDVLLTAILLPGGADLVHSVFNAFSSVFNKVQNSAGS
jgi:hypothetical protein